MFGAGTGILKEVSNNKNFINHIIYRVLKPSQALKRLCSETLTLANSLQA